MCLAQVKRKTKKAVTISTDCEASLLESESWLYRLLGLLNLYVLEFP